MTSDQSRADEPSIPFRSFYTKGNSSHEVFRAGLDDYVGAMSMWFSQCEAICESPIEKLLLACLVTRMRIEQGCLFLAIPQVPPKITNGMVYLVPQVSIGDFRVDFMIYDGRREEACRTVIECDGHDFHERTKEQAKRDRSRDRWFTAQGIPVLRFTGSEIFNDPFVVADEIARWIART